MVVVEEDPAPEDFVREMTVDPTARSCRRKVVGKFKNNPGTHASWLNQHEC